MFYMKKNLHLDLKLIYISLPTKLGKVTPFILNGITEPSFQAAFLTLLHFTTGIVIIALSCLLTFYNLITGIGLPESIT